MVNVEAAGNNESQIIEEILERTFGLRRVYGASRSLLIINAYGGAAKLAVKSASRHSLLLVNADDKNVRTLIMHSDTPVVTYGLNARACVTASSIVDEHYRIIQCCVQRRLPVIGIIQAEGALYKAKELSNDESTAEYIEEQEFSVTMGDSNITVSGILACAAAALLCGIPVENVANLVTI